MNKKAPLYKIWVEPSGNNHPVVKGILKRRTWFSSHQQYDPSESFNQSGFVNYEDTKPVAPPNLIWT